MDDIFGAHTAIWREVRFLFKAFVRGSQEVGYLVIRATWLVLSCETSFLQKKKRRKRRRIVFVSSVFVLFYFALL